MKSKTKKHQFEIKSKRGNVANLKNEKCTLS